MPNAWHHPARARDAHRSIRNSLRGLGCMRLLCGGPHFGEPPTNFFSSNLKNLTALL